MPKKVYNNVEDHRIICDKKTVEDVTSVVLPTIEHPTSSMTNVSGLAGDIDMPNPVRVNAMELSVAHNNGINCAKLATPDNHTIEFRVVRQCFDVKGTTMGHKLIKYRMKCLPLKPCITMQLSKYFFFSFYRPHSPLSNFTPS